MSKVTQGFRHCRRNEFSHQYLGTPLTQKQLLLLGIASPATVRRHVKRLIKTGMLVKHLPPSDHRVVYFTLTDSAINYFRECLQAT